MKTVIRASIERLNELERKNESEDFGTTKEINQYLYDLGYDKGDSYDDKDFCYISTYYYLYDDKDNKLDHICLAESYEGDRIVDRTWERMSEEESEEEKSYTTEEKYDMLVDYCIADEETIKLVICINGWSDLTLEDILYAKTGYRDFSILEENED